ncbi:hypothetical protein F4777DRAFT_582742 [Nemania sp. FL0916]|nr:hypothetical protein F4777DRAFT_582742 [Nemania sp. FL0916]
MAKRAQNSRHARHRVLSIGPSNGPDCGVGGAQSGGRTLYNKTLGQDARISLLYRDKRKDSQKVAREDCVSSELLSCSIATNSATTGVVTLKIAGEGQDMPPRTAVEESRPRDSKYRRTGVARRPASREGCLLQRRGGGGVATDARSAAYTRARAINGESVYEESPAETKTRQTSNEPRPWITTVLGLCPAHSIGRNSSRSAHEGIESTHTRQERNMAMLVGE